MSTQRSTGLTAICVPLLLASCGQVQSESSDTITTKLPPAKSVAERRQVADPHASEGAPPNSKGSVKPVGVGYVAQSRYTSLERTSCRLLEERTADAGSPPWRCEGLGGYALETSATGSPQFAVVGPDGNRSNLDLSGIALNGTLGKLAEWRGESTGRPRALIVRVSAEGRPDISSLVVAKLDDPPCIVAVIGRGPRQNEKARTAADGKQLRCSVQ
jgi:hypothetical protein